MQVKQAAEIEIELEKPQAEPYHSKLIIGNLNFFGKSFSSKIKFDRCIIKGDINFLNCIFKEDLIFDETNFEGNVLFENVIFEKPSKFSSCKFGLFSLAYINEKIPINQQKKIEIRQSCFKDEVNFSSEFYSRVSFKQVKFEKIASFHGAIFSLYASFIRCTFMEGSVFMFSKFEGNTFFNKINFWDKVDFEEATFGKDMGFEYSLDEDRFSRNRMVKNFDFSNSIFNGETSFWKAKFYGNSNFKNTKFLDICNFLGAKFIGNVNFHGAEFKYFAKFGAGSKIFGNTDFSEVVFHKGAYLHDLEFGMKLKLARAQFENLMLEWSSIRDHLEDNWQSNEEFIRLEEVFDKSIIPLYLSLIKNFNGLGLNEDADECYLMLREKKKKNIKDKKGQIIDFFDYALFGYGVKWQNPLYIGLIIMILFSLLFLIFDNHFRINNYEALTNATINSVASFISSPISDNKYIIIISYAERFLGYIIMSCFLITLAKKRLR